MPAIMVNISPYSHKGMTGTAFGVPPLGGGGELSTQVTLAFVMSDPASVPLPFVTVQV